MAFDPIQIARRMCEVSYWSISNLALQKILYIAHMYCLGRENRPLVDGNFEAWAYGPVHPKIYHHLKIFGSGPVTEGIFVSTPGIPDCPETKILDGAVEQLKDVGLDNLIAATHWKDGAWVKNYNSRLRHVKIPNEAIKQEYYDRKERGMV